MTESKRGHSELDQWRMFVVDAPFQQVSSVLEDASLQAMKDPNTPPCRLSAYLLGRCPVLANTTLVREYGTNGFSPGFGLKDLMDELEKNR